MTTNIQNSAFLLIDYQNDFVAPNWALYVKWAETTKKVINELINLFKNKWIKRIATKDWHPQDHISFASTYWLQPFTIKDNNMLWPNHCVQETNWAALYDWIQDNEFDQIILKAYKQNEDAYSGFKWTFLDEYLRANRIKSLFVWWIATDYCVDQSILDAKKLWYQVYVIKEAIKPVFPEKEEEIFNNWSNLWVELISKEDILKKIAI